MVLETACVAVNASYGIRATACYTMQAALAQTPCVLGGGFQAAQYRLQRCPKAA
ncbi:hypothetical protein [Kingella oralis]